MTLDELRKPLRTITRTHEGTPCAWALLAGAHLALLSVAGVLLMSTSAQALTITHAGVAPDPASPILTIAAPSGTGLEGYEWTHGTGTSKALGQIVRMNQPVSLRRITFLVRADTPIAGEYVTLRIAEASDAFDVELGEAIRIESARLPADLPLDVPRWLTLTLNSPLPLAQGARIGLVLSFSGGGGVDDARATVFHAGDDVYADGTALVEFGSFSQALENDLRLILEGSSDDPEPPPPSSAEPLLLRDGRFRIEAFWRAPDGAEGWGRAVPMTSDSGCFWFFDDANLELFVKVLDGCSLNGRYWVFAAGLTNVEVHLTVSDDLAHESRTWINQPGELYSPFADTRTFATCP